MHIYNLKIKTNTFLCYFTGGVTIVTDAEQEIVYKTTAHIARSVSVGNVNIYTDMNQSMKYPQTEHEC